MVITTFSVAVCVVFMATALKMVMSMPPVLYEGDICKLDSERKGMCKLLSKCKPAFERLRKERQRPIHCSFQGLEEVVCCDDDESLQLRKSEIACREYSNEIPLRVRPFITEGTDAEPGDYPHMAALGYIDTSEPGDISWKCGGTLISDRHVLTAAHCVVPTNRRKPPVEVLLGSVNLDDKDMREKYHVKNIVAHPKYSIATSYNDIAIIELDRVVKFSTNIQPACLYSKTEVPQFGLKITGWGATSNNRSSRSAVLQQGTLSIVPNDKCSTFYRNEKKVNRGIDDTMICAGDPNGKTDTCRGDSGGPLQVLTPETSIYSVVGITSLGPTACGGIIPGIYTRVSEYVDWVEDQIWN